VAGAKRKASESTKKVELSKKKLSDQEDREEKIASYLAQLKKNTIDKFTPMQYLR